MVSVTVSAAHSAEWTPKTARDSVLRENERHGGSPKKGPSMGESFRASRIENGK
jgi:hypothetical protein